MKWPPFHPAAREEFDEAFDWYAERSDRLARRFLDSTARTITLLRAHPDAGPPLGRHARRFVIRPFGYSLVYLPAPDDIQVIAVAHHKRRAGYWTDRLPGLLTGSLGDKRTGSAITGRARSFVCTAEV